MKSIMMLFFMLAVNLMLFLGQYAVTAVGTEAGLTPPSFFNAENTPLDSFNSGNYTTPDTIELPEGNTANDDSTGNPFTDLWATISNWALDNPIGRFITAFPTFLKTLGLPEPASWALGAVWYGVALFAFITWIKGGGD